MIPSTLPARFLMPVVLLLAAACTQAGDGKEKATPTAESKPAALEAIEGHGFEVIGEFEGPSGLRGFAGLLGQRPMAVYTTPDGQHALVGTLVDANGEDATASVLQRLVAEPLSKRTWAQLEASHWVRDGREDAPRIVYTFSDPNCPYCNRFWQASRPWVEAGKVQLRHVMVGVIKADSVGKAAAIFEAASPSEALELNEQRFSQGGIAPLPDVSRAVRDKLSGNERLMMELGFRGTPGILFRDEQGLVQRRAGMPPKEDLAVVLGEL